MCVQNIESKTYLRVSEKGARKIEGEGLRQKG